jgi:hypothetical protein
MVTKSDLERVMVKMNAALDRRLQEAAEASRLQFQQHKIEWIQTIIQQSQQNFQVQFQELRSELLHTTPARSSSSPISGKSPLVMTNTHKQHSQGSSSRSSPDYDSGQRADRFIVPRADWPGFNVDNTVEWLRRCQSYFEMHQVPDLLKTKLVTMQFYAHASEWYDAFLIDHEPPDWSTLIRLVRKHFQHTSMKNDMEELKDSHQSGSVEDYMNNLSVCTLSCFWKTDYLLKLTS